MSKVENIKIELSPGREISIETGKLARQAGGSVVVRQGETVVLSTACSGTPRPGIDFFPLQVDYREKFSAAGMFPGGFIKREGRPSEKEVLTMRMTDRPLRPLFPEGFFDEVQIMGSLLSADSENEADVLSMLGASAALTISDIPFAGPVGALRVGRVEGEFIANPTHEEMEKSELDLVYAGVEGKVIMIEGNADEISEEVLRDALAFADQIVGKQCAALNELAEKAGKTKYQANLRLAPEKLQAAIDDFCKGKIEDPCLIIDKQERSRKLSEVREQMIDELSIHFPSDEAGNEPPFQAAFDKATEKTLRRLILENKKRSDGRNPEELRSIECEVGVLPRTHGSALFSRGETQALVTITLGSESDAQGYDIITGGNGAGAGKKHFLLHYNFPPYSVGEVGRIMGVNRREMGHGALAEKCLIGMLPKDYPYTVRCVSDILGSNGSSSMASVCGTSMALMDAGVPIKKPVAGISVGMIDDEQGNRVFLTDILGSEDHYGDMDFKLAGSRDGITGFQLDLKVGGIDLEGLYQAMLINRDARGKIHDSMQECIAEPRSEISQHAPRIVSLHINPEKIGGLIGPGGKNIRAICESSGAQIDIEEDGTVKVFASDSESLELARKEIEKVTAEAEVGKIYRGEVKSVKEFGAFVEILPGLEGLLHISEMADYRVEKTEDICKIGDYVSVKVLDIDEDRGRIRLSRKAALEEM